MADLLEQLNDAQKQAVTHESGPLLIVAGAGTGKTTVLTRRYLWLMNEKKLTADGLVALTFTEKAAQEMEDRVLQQLPNGAYEFWIHTFHGFCQRILERHGLEIGIPNTFRILSETDAWILLKRRLDELPLDHYRPLGNPVKFLHALIRHISRAKDEGVTPDRYVEFAENAVLDGDSADIIGGERKRLKELADVYAAYQKILRDEGALDFGDVIIETLRLFHERPAILNKYQEQFKYLLIDEFQDTNWAQYELIKLLAGPKRNVTVVGDDDQAIYKFRGASLANILQFKDDYPDAATVALTDNYRSHQTILDIAYKVISNNNPHRLEVSLADQGLSKQLKSQITPLPTLIGYADSSPNARNDGRDVRIEWFASLMQEANWVADDILARHGAEAKDRGWDRFAILVRSNDEALPFVDALASRNVPFRFFALRGLYSKPVIVDIMALLKLAVAPNDSTTVWRVLGLPSLKIPLTVLHEAVTYSTRKGISLWDALKQSSIFLKETPEAA
ncbi:MAG: UvrD-helicase domain-containing protein, partial [Patescibacteria group bacterium]|nr:UvrD-helicase domain-containing protein [Patescibacteria group bacterium]